MLSEIIIMFLMRGVQKDNLPLVITRKGTWKS